MPLEIERKFLVTNTTWRHEDRGLDCCQGYLSQSSESTVRVRIIGNRAFITIKGSSHGLSRLEFEYEIPLSDAKELHQLCTIPLIRKTRYTIDDSGKTWEIDEFHDENEGLIIAEVELSDPEEKILLPSWIGKEVSYDPRYRNSNLALHPFRNWK